jgi:multidrug resistance efflux pump
MESQAQILLEPRAEEAQEMLDKRPPVFVRWGSLFFAFSLSVLLAVCYFVEYPDVVEASFKLTSTNAPKPLFAKVNGKLEKLLTSEASSVKTGTILAFLESTASHEQVLRLEKQLLVLQTAFTTRSTSELAAFQKHQFNNLGELQPHYQTFRNTYEQYLAFLVEGFYPRKLTLLNNELTDQAQVYDNVEKQKTLYEHDLKLAQEDFAVQQKLAAQKTIAPLELKREESKLIAKKMALQQIANTLLTTAAAQNAKQKEIMELEKSVQDQHETFAQAMNTLLSSLQQWKSNYVVTSPMDGYVHFSSFLQPNQMVKVGQELFFITPAQGPKPLITFWRNIHWSTQLWQNNARAAGACQVQWLSLPRIWPSGRQTCLCISSTCGGFFRGGSDFDQSNNLVSRILPKFRNTAMICKSSLSTVQS